MGGFSFELHRTDGAARLGRILTGHGAVDTPAFMPVATQGSVKSLAPSDLAAAGAQIVLANTYHLLLRPGHELVRELGGLHRFMGWDGPILTDDVLHPLDECLAQPATVAETERSLALTLRWLDLALAAHRAAGAPGALFGIVQGGAHEALRRRAVEAVGALDLPGHAIGGLAVGEPKPLMYDITELVAGLLPPDRPRYLMGVGKPPDLVEAVARGVDLFDCVLPTRNARNGQAFTADGPLNISNARFARDPAPLDGDCSCEACRRFSRAYLRHLFLARELLAYRLLTLHNLTFYLGLMRDTRDAVARGAFEGFRSRFLERYGVESLRGSADTPADSEA